MSARLAYLAYLVAAISAIPLAAAAPILPEGAGRQAAMSPFDAAMTRAHEALAANRSAEARKFFEQAAGLNPQSILPWLGLADVARLGNDERGVETALRKAAELGPDRAEPVIAMARLHYSHKSYDEAERLLRKAAKMDPSSPIPLVDLGDLYAGVRRDPDKALGYYRDAIRVAPKHAGAHYALGALLLMRRDALGAIPSLQTAQELVGGKNPLPSLALGRAYGMARKWKDAQEAYGRALAIQPDLADAYLGRGMAWVESGNRAQALADLRKAEELDGKRAEVPLRIGMLHQDAGAAAEAYEAYQRAIRIEPNLTLAYNNLAWLAATRRERLDEALDWIRKARAIDPREPIFCDTQGWVLRARGDLDGAATVLAEGIALRPGAELYYHLGVVQMEKGMAREARENLRKALLAQPDFSDSRDARKRLGELEAAPGK